MMWPWINWFAAAVLLAGCGGQPAHGRSPLPEVGQLVGSEWVAESIEGMGVLRGVSSTLSFDASDRVSGDTGCNRFAGPLATQGQSVQFGPLATTRRACPPEVMAQEARYTQALERVRALRREGAALLLLDEAQRTLVRLTRLERAG